MADKDTGIGVSADTWWWTEVPLDVSGKDADLTAEDRQVELEFRCVGWDEQPGSVLSHTVEWKLTEVGEEHQQWNPTLKGGKGGLEWVDAHLIQQGEKMILHVPWPGGGLRGRAGGLRYEGLGRGGDQRAERLSAC